jgi:hypothetical protein
MTITLYILNITYFIVKLHLVSCIVLSSLILFSSASSIDCEELSDSFIVQLQSFTTKADKIDDITYKNYLPNKIALDYTDSSIHTNVHNNKVLFNLPMIDSQYSFPIENVTNPSVKTTKPHHNFNFIDDEGFYSLSFTNFNFTKSIDSKPIASTSSVLSLEYYSFFYYKVHAGKVSVSSVLSNIVNYEQLNDTDNYWIYINSNHESQIRGTKISFLVFIQTNFQNSDEFETNSYIIHNVYDRTAVNNIAYRFVYNLKNIIPANLTIQNIQHRFDPVSNNIFVNINDDIYFFQPSKNINTGVTPFEELPYDFNSGIVLISRGNQVAMFDLDRVLLSSITLYSDWLRRDLLYNKTLYVFTFKADNISLVCKEARFQFSLILIVLPLVYLLRKFEKQEYNTKIL